MYGCIRVGHHVLLRSERIVLLLSFRMQKNARKLRSLEKNGCPTLGCIGWFSFPLFPTYFLQFRCASLPKVQIEVS